MYTKFVLLSMIFFIFSCCAARAEDFYNVKYRSNYDGDTIRFDIDESLPDIFRFMPLRLYGIDTPELRSKNSREKRAAYKAKKFVQRRLSRAKVINLKDCKKDKYFRLNCRVEYDGKDLTQELLKRKYGYEYYGGAKQKFGR